MVSVAVPKPAAGAGSPSTDHPFLSPPEKETNRSLAQGAGRGGVQFPDRINLVRKQVGPEKQEALDWALRPPQQSPSNLGLQTEEPYSPTVLALCWKPEIKGSAGPCPPGGS